MRFEAILPQNPKKLPANWQSVPTSECVRRDLPRSAASCPTDAQAQLPQLD
jgi:hypothetical protein